MINDKPDRTNKSALKKKIYIQTIKRKKTSIDHNVNVDKKSLVYFNI